MTQGRFKQGRYQQGIGVPETLGVQPTTWNEPQPPALNQSKWDAGSVGFSRNYGSTPDYVDTWKSRWTVPKGGNLVKGLGASMKNRQNKKFDAQSAEELGITPGELRTRRAEDIRGRRLEADRGVISRTSAPTTRPGEDPSVTARRGAW